MLIIISAALPPNPDLEIHFACLCILEPSVASTEQKLYDEVRGLIKQRKAFGVAVFCCNITTVILEFQSFYQQDLLLQRKNQLMLNIKIYLSLYNFIDTFKSA